MRKTTMAMTLGLALSLGAVGVASAQATQQPQRSEQGERGWGRGPGKGLLKGINLTDAQKAKLKELRKSEHSNASNEQFRKAMADARAARQRGDTAAARAQMQALRPQMEQARERQVAAMRSILTPDQLKQFDANVAEMKQHAGERRAGREGGHEGRRAGAPNDR
ncbi:MAG TPA: Spy/CpxP family protein refolding chaperone [Gemmatimonadaceae bacterium]|nr:Spy/CpxP family protein refolding chaperone [Gemmatimonadaceae bacterium]